jgi:hypothetical protein
MKSFGSSRAPSDRAAAGRTHGTGGPARAIFSVAAAWILCIGFDLFFHAGLIARLYLEPSPFLLPPEVAFQRIPLGYLAFLGLTLGLFWLLRRLDVKGALAGFRHGAAAGAVVWGVLSLGLYSISTAPPPLLAAWWTGQAVELGLAGAVLGAAANGMPLRRIWTTVALTVVVLVAATIALQSLGYAPAMKTTSAMDADTIGDPGMVADDWKPRT